LRRLSCFCASPDEAVKAGPIGRETFHPFEDRNGRLDHALVDLILAYENLTGATRATASRDLSDPAALD
jgi:Fic family protein